MKDHDSPLNGLHSLSGPLPSSTPHRVARVTLQTAHDHAADVSAWDLRPQPCALHVLGPPALSSSDSCISLLHPPTDSRPGLTATRFVTAGPSYGLFSVSVALPSSNVPRSGLMAICHSVPSLNVLSSVSSSPTATFSHGPSRLLQHPALLESVPQFVCVCLVSVSPRQKVF